MGAFRNLSVLAVSGALLATACGGGGVVDQESDGPSPTVTSDSPAEPIKLMALGQLEAETFAFPELVDGVEARAARYNEEGSGPPLEIIECNDQNDPNEGANCARRAVEEGVAAVVGAFSYQGASILPILEDAGIPYVAHRMLNPVDSQSPVAYPIDGGLGALFAGVGVALADSGCETTVLLREDTPANQVVDTFVAAGLELRGQEVQRTIVVPTQTPDAAPAVQTAVSEGADCAALSINPTDIVKVITAFRQNAPDIKLAAGATAVSPATVEGLGEDAEGLLLIDQYYGLGSDRPAIQQFHSDMDTYAPEAAKSFWSLKAWGGTELIIRMIEQEGANDAETLNRALNEIDSIDLGIVGAFGTTEANPTAGLERVFNTQILWFEIQDGDYVPASDGFVDIGDAMTAGG